MTRLLAGALLATTGCLFLPNVQQYGYTPCASDDDCAPGRSCDVEICAPPPWRDDQYKIRRLLVVHSDAPMAKGTAVPVRIGEGGLLPIDDFGADGRFTFFERSTSAWLDAPSFLDVRPTFLDAWLPVREDVPAGGDAALAWIETRHEGDADPPAIQDPNVVFPFFDDFDDPALDPATYRVGGAPLVDDEGLTVADNQVVIWRERLQPPFALTFRARINGATCDQTFLGVYGDDTIATYAAPSAGLFVGAALSGDLEIAPNVDANPTPANTPATLDTAPHRYTIWVDVDRVEARVDDAVVGSFDLPSGFDAEAVFPVVDVDGACSVTVEAVWATPLPLPPPTVTAEDAVGFKILP